MSTENRIQECGGKAPILEPTSAIIFKLWHPLSETGCHINAEISLPILKRKSGLGIHWKDDVEALAPTF